MWLPEGLRRALYQLRFDSPNRDVDHWLAPQNLPIFDPEKFPRASLKEETVEGLMMPAVRDASGDHVRKSTSAQCGQQPVTAHPELSQAIFRITSQATVGFVPDDWFGSLCFPIRTLGSWLRERKTERMKEAKVPRPPRCTQRREGPPPSHFGWRPGHQNFLLQKTDRGAPSKPSILKTIACTVGYPICFSAESQRQEQAMKVRGTLCFDNLLGFTFDSLIGEQLGADSVWFCFEKWQTSKKLTPILNTYLFTYIYKSL